MRKLKLQVQLTVDGFIAGPNGEMDWMTVPWTDDINQYVGDITDPVDTIVLGRKLAEGFIPHWAAVAGDENDPEYASGRKFTETPKVVFTKTLNSTKWPHTKLAKGDMTEEINKLKSREGGDLIAYGGGSFVTDLIRNNLIDEYYLFINPVAIGQGMHIFSGRNSYLNMELEDTQAFDCGIVLLHCTPRQ